MNNYTTATRSNYIIKKRRKKIHRILLLVILISLTLIIKYNKSSYKKSHDLNAKATTQPSTNLNGKSTDNKDSVANLIKEEPIKPETTENINDSTLSENDNNSNSQKNIDEVNSSRYDFAKPVPLNEAVEDSYFDDAVFIGDSRTEGFMLYSPPSKGIAFTYKGLMVDTVFTSPVIKKDGNKITVMEALKKADFHKVYIMLGINETGWIYTDIFIKKYGEIIDSIKESHPDAIIYVQSILPVSHKVSSTHSYIKNAKINEYNSNLLNMAKEKEIYYLDVAEAVINENGCLPDDASTDGIHLKKSYCQKWLEYLKTHTIK